MWWVFLATLSWAQSDRTACQRVARTPSFLSGARVMVKPDCSAAEALDGEEYGRGLCGGARMFLLFPDPYVADQMRIEFVETRPYLRLKDRDDPQGRHKIDAHNAWLEAGQTVYLGLKSGRTLPLVLQERAQARPYASVGEGYSTTQSSLRWKVRVALSPEDARALSDGGLVSWAFAAPGIDVQHRVKKAKRLDETLACLFP